MRKLRNSELNRLSVDEFKRANKLPITVVLDDVRSHHNVGSIFRTCDALRIEKVVLGGITPTPPHPEIEKTALGATLSMDWEYSEDLLRFLSDSKKQGYHMVALEHTDESISIMDHLIGQNGKPVLLIFGNEVKGVQDAILKECDSILEIPQAGTKHSFNVSVSAGIALWEIAKSYA